MNDDKRYYNGSQPPLPQGTGPYQPPNTYNPHGGYAQDYAQGPQGPQGYLQGPQGYPVQGGYVQQQPQSYAPGPQTVYVQAPQPQSSSSGGCLGCLLGICACCAITELFECCCSIF